MALAPGLPHGAAPTGKWEPSWTQTPKPTQNCWRKCKGTDACPERRSLPEGGLGLSWDCPGFQSPPCCGPQLASTYHLLPRPQDAQLAKAHVEGRASEGAVRLLHHQDVNATAQRGRVQASVYVLHRPQHCPCQLPHVVHGWCWQMKEVLVPRLGSPPSVGRFCGPIPRTPSTEGADQEWRAKVSPGLQCVALGAPSQTGGSCACRCGF